jgi:hypothetical protein
VSGEHSEDPYLAGIMAKIGGDDSRKHLLDGSKVEEALKEAMRPRGAQTKRIPEQPETPLVSRLRDSAQLQGVLPQWAIKEMASAADRIDELERVIVQFVDKTVVLDSSIVTCGECGGWSDRRGSGFQVHKVGCSRIPK